MICSLDDLRRKEVIDISDGERLGYIDDVEIDLETSETVSLVIFGRLRLFGLLGREEDIVIACRDIKVVGKEVLLVKRPDNKILTEVINSEEKRSKSLLKQTKN